MCLIRAFDSTLPDLYTRGLSRGSSHAALGQEVEVLLDEEADQFGSEGADLGNPAVPHRFFRQPSLAEGHAPDDHRARRQDSLNADDPIRKRIPRFVRLTTGSFNKDHWFPKSRANYRPPNTETEQWTAPSRRWLSPLSIGTI